MLVCVEIGFRVARKRTALGESAPSGVVDGAVFALLGLLVAFTFSGAATRFEVRRALIVQEANDIGTAYLRLDLLAPEPRAALQDIFRRYVDARLAIYRAIPDVAATDEALAAATRIQQEIWAKAVAASQGQQPATMLLLPALNDMFDITSTRTAATRMHPPTVIYVLLIVLALISALLAGRSMVGAHGRLWMHSIFYALAMSAAVYVIIDMEFPRFGLIRVDAFDSMLVDLRNGMK